MLRQWTGFSVQRKSKLRSSRHRGNFASCRQNRTQVVHRREWAFHRSATVSSRMSAVVADSVTVQAVTSLAMAPKPRLFFLTTRAENRDAWFRADMLSKRA